MKHFLTKATSTAAAGLSILVSGFCLSDAIDIETVLVTATLRDQSGAVVPLSWREVDAAEIDLIRHTHINELMQRVPGAWISRGSAQEHLTALRSPVLTGAGGCGSFYMAVDGIALRAPGFCNVNQLFDANSEQASQVEVIKGPATALYGSNAMHGVINFLSVPPSKHKQQALGLDVGGFGYIRGRYRLQNGWDNQGISLLANFTSDQGYVDDAGFDQQKISLRYDNEATDWHIKTLVEYANLNQETSGYIVGYEAYEDSAIKRQNPNPEAFRDAESFRAYAPLKKKIDTQNELIVTPYLRSNDMEFKMHFVPWQPIESNGHQSFGLRSHWVHFGPGYDWVSGIDLDYSNGWLTEIQNAPFSLNQPQGAHYDYDVIAKNSALFSQLSVTLTERIVVEAGYRYEVMDYDYSNNLSDGSGCAAEATACRFYRPASRSDRFGDASLNLGMSVQLADKNTAYFRIAEGFRAPQAAELYRLQGGQEQASLQSEALKNIEVGVRGLIGDHFAYDASVYSMVKDNVIFQDANRFNVSGAKTKHQGLELSLDYSLLANLHWSFDGTYAQHTYASNVNLLGVSGDIQGNDMDTAPRYFGSTALAWQYQEDSRLELEWVFMSRYFLEPQSQFEYAGHKLVNLRVSHALSDALKASFRITNLVNVNYAERADYSFGNYQYFAGEPRAFYVSVDVDI